MSGAAASGRRPLARAGGGASAGEREAGASFACVLPDSADSMIPPPRQISPSYSTADWPGVTAHCASSNASEKRASPAGPGVAAPNARRVGLPVARLRPARETFGRRFTGDPAHVAGDQLPRQQPRMIVALHDSVFVAMSFAATNHGSPLPVLLPPRPMPLRWPNV